MKKEPLVSVILPFLNAEDFLPESIESVLNQSYKNFELILIDDGSTDSSYKISEKYSKKDPRIRLFKNKKNYGVGYTRNYGIELAKGKYIAWQDADDISTNDRIIKQVEYLEKHPKVGVVGGFIEFFGNNIKSSVRKYEEKDSDLRKNIFKFNPVAQPVSMYRKSVFEEVGNFNPDYLVSEDLEMLLRVGTKYEFANIQRLLLKYRQCENSLTRSKLKKMEIATILLRLKFSKHSAYSPTLIDYIYNIAQFCSIFLLPANLKIRIFNFFRNN